METSIFKEISSLETEVISADFIDIDTLNTQDILQLINSQDKLVADAVATEIPSISTAVDAIVHAFQVGGRLLYVGAGTSGRLGILDAAECPPTFGSVPSMVQGIIAGGNDAAFRAIEGAEDLTEDGVRQIELLNVSDKDVVCGIAASGRTPWVIASVKKAKQLGAITIFISTVNKQKLINNEIGKYTDVFICPQVGPEVVAGSTRMKSGTAQKLILNMLTTTAMIKIGKTYQNIMVDLKPTNNKLKERAKGILMTICNIDYATATQVLIETNYNVKVAIIMLLYKVDITEANAILSKQNGRIRE